MGPSMNPFEGGDGEGPNPTCFDKLGRLITIDKPYGG